jgi:hypothetical protein
MSAYRLTWSGGEPCADGVYLTQSDKVYFDQVALGSSDLSKLHQQGEGYWWSSPFNPDLKKTTSKELHFGKALHAIILEGRDAYTDRYAISPDLSRVEGLFDSVKEIKAHLASAGFLLKGTSGWSKPEWVEALRENAPDAPCETLILERFLSGLGDGQPTLTAYEDRILRIMLSVAERNPDIAQLLKHDDFPALPEVAVFWTAPDGVRYRWKFDRLFPQFSMDLKSLGAWSGRPLAWAVGDVIAKRGYDIQRAWYHYGREVMYNLIREGRIFGGTDRQAEWLSLWPDAYPEFDWVWLFYQKPDPAGRAPVILPIYDDGPRLVGDVFVKSDLHIYGERKALRALATYRRCMATFGPDEPWSRVEPLHYTDETCDPVIHFPHWIQADEPTEADAYSPEENRPDV